ncbi:MAG: undecaprenyl-diphosphate phosphatase [Clostridia bacterium]|nr:undecaprenyl-diphosphate phosphatase [Clostridia bacterium]
MWLEILKGLVLGLIQGLTEFLPVSSSGHLLLAERLGLTPPNVLVNLILHLATLLAVCIAMRREVWGWIRHPLSRRSRWLLLMCLPTAGVAFALAKLTPELVEGAWLPLGFLATSALLLIARTLPRGDKPLTASNALLTGLVHGVAVLPGLSRSGATVTAMRLQGIPQEEAVTLSFLSSIPVIVGGIVLEIIEGVALDGVSPALLVTATITAFLSGLAGLKWMLKAFGRSYLVFGIYTLALAIASAFV